MRYFSRGGNGSILVDLSRILRSYLEKELYIEARLKCQCMDIKSLIPISSEDYKDFQYDFRNYTAEKWAMVPDEERPHLTKAYQDMTSRIKSLVSWTRPESGVKLNVDGSTNRGIGGILRSGKGDFIWAFSQRISGVSDSDMMEKMAVKRALEIYLQFLRRSPKDYSSPLTLESDSRGLANLLYAAWGDADVTIDTKLMELLTELKTVQERAIFKHALRGANYAAHHLACNNKSIDGEEVMIYTKQKEIRQKEFAKALSHDKKFVIYDDRVEKED